MTTYNKITSVFPRRREEKLRAMKRYSMTDVFFYRSSLWHHALRVHLIVNELGRVLQPAFPKCDWRKTSVLALVHDDAEMLTGDIQLGHKQVMTPTQLQQVHDNEAMAIKVLAKDFPREVDGYVYEELLSHALDKDCIEAQIVSWADKVDAYCESLHEVLAGNMLALRSVINYARIDIEFKHKYPALKPLFEFKHVPLTNIGLRTDMWHVHRSSYTWLNKPHTRQSIQRETEFSFYNTWKKLILENLGQEGVKVLTTRIETL